MTHQKYSESYFIPSNGDLSVISALTRWGDRPAAWRGQWWARNHAARRVGGHVRQGPHSVTGALVVHSHAVREGVTHRVVGLTIMAANLPRFPTGILRTEHKQIYKVHIYTHTHSATATENPMKITCYSRLTGGFPEDCITTKTKLKINKYLR